MRQVDGQTIEMITQNFSNSQQEELNQIIIKETGLDNVTIEHLEGESENIDLAAVDLSLGIIDFIVAGLSWDLLKLTIKKATSYMEQKDKSFPGKIWVRMKVRLKNNSSKMLDLYVDTDDIDKSIDGFAMKIETGWVDDNKDKDILALTYEAGKIDAVSYSY